MPLPVISGFMSGVGCIILATQSLAVLGFEPVGSALVRCLAVRYFPSALELQPPQLATVMHVGSSLLSGVLEPQYLLRYLLNPLISRLSIVLLPQQARSCWYAVQFEASMEEEWSLKRPCRF